MINPKFVGLGAGLALGISFLGAVTALGKESAALPEHVSLSENAGVLPTVRLPSSIHLNALGGGRSMVDSPGSSCTVAIGPGASPIGYVPLASFGVTPLPAVGDDQVIDQSVPAFNFAGETYTKIGFSTNGYAVIGDFTAADNTINNQNFPNASRPNNVLAPFWTDLNPSISGTMRIAVVTDGEDSWIVLDWLSVREFSTANENSFQIWIGVNDDTNPIEDISFVYGIIEGNGDGGFLSVGAENRFGNSGQNTYFNGAGTLPSNGTELRVTTTSCLTPRAVNLSTRMRVQTADSIGVGGFIITGTAPKHVIIRAIGPSLSAAGVPDALADPVLELHGPGGFVTVINDDWRDTQESAILASGIPPSNDLESAIDITLNPGAYTALVSGLDGTTGVGLVEVYDLNEPVLARLANLSTRAFVNTGDNIVIGGFFLSNHSGTDRIVVRGIGPSLTASGVPNALADPFLELRDGNGGLILANDDWQDDSTQAALVTAAGLAPSHSFESAIAATLPPGRYTGLLGGLGNTTGIGLVEVYDLGP